MMRCSLQPFELYAYAKINPKTKRLKQCLFKEASSKVQIQKKKKKKTCSSLSIGAGSKVVNHYSHLQPFN